jgi:hypothetical protein
MVMISKEIGLEINADKTKYEYMGMPLGQYTGRSHSIKIYNSSFERVEGFKYLERTVTSQNSIQEEIKSILKSGNACYHSAQFPLSYNFLSKNLKIRKYRTIILPVVLCGYEILSLLLREERRLRVSENTCRVLSGIFGLKREEVTREWRELHKQEFYDTCMYSLTIVRVIKSRRMRLVEHVARMEEGKGVYRVLVGKPEGKRET